MDFCRTSIGLFVNIYVPLVRVRWRHGLRKKYISLGIEDTYIFQQLITEAQEMAINSLSYDSLLLMSISDFAC